MGTASSSSAASRDPEVLAAGRMLLPRVVASPRAASHQAVDGGPRALDPASLPDDVPAGGFFSYDADDAPWSVARCLHASGMPRPATALGLATATPGFIDHWFDPPPLSARRPVPISERDSPALDALRQELRALLAPWPLLLAAHCRHAVFDGHPPSAGVPTATPRDIDALEPNALRDVVQATKANLSGLRALLRCLLSEIEHAGDVGAKPHDALCTLDPHLARMLDSGIVTVHTVSTRRGGTMVLPYAGACLAFAMAHHVHIAPPRPYASVHVSRYGSGEGVWSGPEPPTMQALGIKDDRLKCNRDNTLVLDEVTRLPTMRATVSHGKLAAYLKPILCFAANAQIASLHREKRMIALSGPAWWVMRAPCPDCARVGAACIACIGSAEDPRRHVVRDPITGESMMVDCAACAARVDAALALGEVVSGVGLGGSGSHCGSSTTTPGALYCSPPLDDSTPADAPSSATPVATAHPNSACGPSTASTSSSTTPSPATGAATPSAPAAPLQLGYPPSGGRRPEPYYGYKHCKACHRSSHNYNVLCTTCTIDTGVAHIHDDALYCPRCDLIFAVECPNAHSWGCGSRPGADGVVPVDVTLHELPIVDAIGRVANPPLTVELRIIQRSHPSKRARDGCLGAAASALLRRLVHSSPLARVVAAAATPPPLPTPGSGPAALWGVDPRNPLLALSTPAFSLPAASRPHPHARPAAVLGTLLAAAQDALRDADVALPPAPPAMHPVHIDGVARPAGVPIDGFALPVGVIIGGRSPLDPPTPVHPSPAGGATVPPTPNPKARLALVLKLAADLHTLADLCASLEASARASALPPESIASAHSRRLHADMCAAAADIDVTCARAALGRARDEAAFKDPITAASLFAAGGAPADADGLDAELDAYNALRAAHPTPPAPTPAAPVSVRERQAEAARLHFAKRAAARAPAPHTGPTPPSPPPGDADAATRDAMAARLYFARRAEARLPPDPPPAAAAPTSAVPDAIVSRGKKWYQHTDGRWSIRGGPERFVYGRDGRTHPCLADGLWRFRDGRCYWVHDHHQRWVECPPGGLREDEAQHWLRFLRRSSRSRSPSPSPSATDRRRAVPAPSPPASHAPPSHAHHAVRTPSIDLDSPIVGRRGKWSEHRDGLWSLADVGKQRFAWLRNGKTVKCLPDDRWRRSTNGANLWALDHHRRWIECPAGGVNDADLPAWLATQPPTGPPIATPAPATAQPARSTTRTAHDPPARATKRAASRSPTPSPSPTASASDTDPSRSRRVNDRRHRRGFNPDHDDDDDVDTDASSDGSDLGDHDAGIPVETADDGAQHIGPISADAVDARRGSPTPSAHSDDGTPTHITGGSPSDAVSDSDLDSPRAAAQDASPSATAGVQVPRVPHASLATTLIAPSPAVPDRTAGLRGSPPTESQAQRIPFDLRHGRGSTPGLPAEADPAVLGRDRASMTGFPGYRTWSTLVLAPAGTLAAAEARLIAAFSQLPSTIVGVDVSPPIQLASAHPNPPEPEPPDEPPDDAVPPLHDPRDFLLPPYPGHRAWSTLTLAPVHSLAAAERRLASILARVSVTACAAVAAAAPPSTWADALRQALRCAHHPIADTPRSRPDACSILPPPASSGDPLPPASSGDPPGAPAAPETIPPPARGGDPKGTA
jgi:hypothetical protein